jgi:hypothetical protein
MKKLLLIPIFTITALLNISIAQNIWDIQASFCNTSQTEKEIDLVTKANIDTDICIKFQNNSIQDTSIAVDFTDGAITPQWSKACFSPEKPRTNFGQYVQNTDNTFNISWWTNIEKHYKIKYPVWFSGVSHGCLWYYVNNTDKIWWWIWLIFRKTHSIDILVWWTEINSNIIFKNIYITGDLVSNRISIDIENNWNINQEIYISWTISNLFWYQQNFTIQTTTLLANNSITINTDTLNIPDYKGLFKINTNLNYKPKFNFDITNHNIPTQYISPWTIIITKSIILRNWFYIVWLSLIAILLSINTIRYFKK